MNNLSIQQNMDRIIIATKCDFSHRIEITGDVLYVDVLYVEITGDVLYVEITGDVLYVDVLYVEITGYVLYTWILGYLEWLRSS